MLEPITTHEDDAAARLPSQFREATLINAFIRSLSARFQNLDDVFQNLFNLRWIDTASGAQLDGLGEIVGEYRRGRDDYEYRLAIILKIAINTSKGTPEEIINIFSLLTGSELVELLEFYPGVIALLGTEDFSVIIEGDGPDAFAFAGSPDGLGFSDVFFPLTGGSFVSLIPQDVGALYAIMDRVIAGGVRIEYLGIMDELNAFAFEGGPPGGGFGDVFDLGLGGEFASIIPA